MTGGAETKDSQFFAVALRRILRQRGSAAEESLLAVPSFTPAYLKSINRGWKRSLPEDLAHPAAAALGSTYEEMVRLGARWASWAELEIGMVRVPVIDTREPGGPPDPHALETATVKERFLLERALCVLRSRVFGTTLWAAVDILHDLASDQK